MAQGRDVHTTDH